QVEGHRLAVKACEHARLAHLGLQLAEAIFDLWPAPLLDIRVRQRLRMHPELSKVAGASFPTSSLILPAPPPGARGHRALPLPPRLRLAPPPPGSRSRVRDRRRRQVTRSAGRLFGAYRDESQRAPPLRAALGRCQPRCEVPNRMSDLPLGGPPCPLRFRG